MISMRITMWNAVDGRNPTGGTCKLLQPQFFKKRRLA